MEYFDHIIPIGGLILFAVTSIVWIKTEMTKRPTYDETNDKYTAKDSCRLITQHFQDTLNCIPDMKESMTRIETKLDIWMKNNEGN